MPRKRDERLLSLLSLAIKFGVILVATISCVKLMVAHHRIRGFSRELAAEYARQQGRLLVARRAFDHIFQIHPGMRAGQWVVPNRQRVVWNSPAHPDAANTGSPSP